MVAVALQFWQGLRTDPPSHRQVSQRTRIQSHADVKVVQQREMDHVATTGWLTHGIP